MVDPARGLLDRLVTWSPVLLLGSLAALTYWLDAQIEVPAQHADGSRRHDVDIYVENLRAVSYGADGKPLQLLSATRADHYPDDDTTVLTNPDLVLKDPKQPTFAVTADSAKVGGDRNNVWFSGNVHAKRDAEPASTDAQGNERSATGAISLTTEYLHVLPREKRAETDKAVTIEEARGIIHAIGMNLDADKKTVKFLSRLQGTLQPQALPK
ncbi:MAG: LPS export ABC transporter periplasmic protein LptC [Casimicrobiaceae bacterium]